MGRDGTLSRTSPGGSFVKTRLASSLALAAIVSLGFTGCGLVAPQATLEHYAPSDGVEFNLQEVEVRNLMLITNTEAEEFNVVFVGINNGEQSAKLNFRFESPNGSSSATADFTLRSGSNSFGDLEHRPTVVSLDAPVGSMVTAYIQMPGGEIERQIPVIDGTLRDDSGNYIFPEYHELVP